MPQKAALFFVFIIAGCSNLALGDPWSPLLPPANMALVNIYAGESLSTAQKLHIDDTPDTPDSQRTIQMVDGGYYPYLVPPGAIRFFTGDNETGSCVTGLVNDGGVYYIRVHEKDGEQTVEWVRKDEGEVEIAGKRRMPREMFSPSANTFGPDCRSMQ